MNPITMKLVVDDLILQALREDITFEDVSTASVCPTARPATVELIAKADGIIAGLDVFARTFELLDPQSSVLFDVADGERCTPVTTWARCAAMRAYCFRASAWRSTTCSA